MVQNQIAAGILAQDHDELKSVVNRIVDAETTASRVISATKIGRSAGTATAGIFRVIGQAKTNSGETAWSAVVKALGEPEVKRDYREEDPLRELAVYRSGAFAEGCGGVRSARCYGIQQHDDGQLLWLEDLSDAPQPPWQAEHFIATARHLGQFNGHWPQHALPAWEWLSQLRFRAQFTGDPGYRNMFERLPTRQEHSLMQIFAPSPTMQVLMQLWEESDRLLIQAEGTPKGICHLDCHPKNLFPIVDANGTRYTIGIDWVKVGIANLGIDIGHLLASPMTWLEVTAAEANALRDPIFDAYLTGLVDAGWSGNEDGVRLTYRTDRSQ